VSASAPPRSFWHQRLARSADDAASMRDCLRCDPTLCAIGLCESKLHPLSSHQPLSRNARSRSLRRPPAAAVKPSTTCYLDATPPGDRTAGNRAATTSFARFLTRTDVRTSQIWTSSTNGLHGSAVLSPYPPGGFCATAHDNHDYHATMLCDIVQTVSLGLVVQSEQETVPPSELLRSTC
jgi:hypothetical protein